MTKKAATKAEKAHLGRLAALGCVICGAEAQIHHLRHGMGMGQRNSHYNAVPLCFLHHTGPEGIHGLGTREFERRYGTESELLAQVRAELGV